MEDVLKAKFRGRTLKSLRDPGSSIAAAVARRHHPNHMDQLDIFDTHLNISFSVVDVLKASACAPVYFETPTSIGDMRYVDGGVGGNCPLAMAIPRMAEIMGSRGKLEVVLSIAPPGEKDNKDQSSVLQWMQWFATELTDGYAVYLGQENTHPATVFLRISPTSATAGAYTMDSLDIDGMVNSVKSESIEASRYFYSVLQAGLVLASTGTVANMEEYNRISWWVADYYNNNRAYKEAMKVIKASVSYNKRTDKMDLLALDYERQARCYFWLGKYRKGEKAAKLSLTTMHQRHAQALEVLALCLVRQSKYQEAAEAIQRCKAGLHSEQSPRRRSVILMNLGDCYHWMAVDETKDEDHKADLMKSANETYYHSFTLLHTLPDTRVKRRSIAVFLTNIAKWNMDQGKPKKADELYENSKEMAEKANDLYVEAVALGGIGASKMAQAKVLQDLEEAEKYLRQSLNKFETDELRSFWPDVEVARVLRSLGELQQAKSKLVELEEKLKELSRSEQNLVKALVMFEKVLPNSHHEMEDCDTKLRTTNEMIEQDGKTADNKHVEL